MPSPTPSTSKSTSVPNGVASLPKRTNTIFNTPGTSNIPFASAAKEASNAWRNFENAVKTLTEHSSVFSKIIETLDQQNALQHEVQQKDARIAALESSNNICFEENAKRWRKWEEEKFELKRQMNEEKSLGDRKVKDVQSSLVAQAQKDSDKQKKSHEQEVKELKRELSTAKNEMTTLKDELRKAGTRMERAEKEIGLRTNQLKKWEFHVSILKPVDFKAFKGKLEKLFVRCQTVVRGHLLRNLPENILEDPNRWSLLLNSLNVQLMFPPTNTPAAMLIRTATFLHVIAHRIFADIFKPCYIPTTFEVSEVIKDILATQFETDKNNERITRALLLSTYSSEEMEMTIEETINTTSKDICQLLNPFGADASFQNEMEQLLYEAAGLWKEAQYSTKMVEVSMTDEDFESWPWAHLDEFSSPIAGTKAPAVFRDWDKLTLFPRVYVPEDGDYVFPGYILMPNQDAVLVAQQEYIEWRNSKKSKNGRTASIPGVLRRLSVAHDEGNGNGNGNGNGVKSEERQPFLARQQKNHLGSQILTGNHGKG